MEKEKKSSLGRLNRVLFVVLLALKCMASFFEVPNLPVF
jgi:hypothetical protein